MNTRMQRRQRAFGLFLLDTGYMPLIYLFTLATSLIALNSLIGLSNFSSWTGKAFMFVKALNDTSNDQGSVIELAVRYARLPIDHDNLNGNSFQNRYWVNDKYFEPGGPVFVYDVGEDEAASSVERFLQRPTSFMGQLMQEFHGLGILWEHRYYGESLPLPVNDNSTVEDYRFLTLRQSLADLPYFANNFQADLKPTSTPWIMLGCSYAGTHAALSRLMHPETFFAAYAGEAPVLFNATANRFWNPLYSALVDNGYHNCSRDLHTLVQHIDSQLLDPRTALSIKQQFFGRGAGIITNEQLSTAIGSFYAYFKGWGITQGKPSVAALCEYLENKPVSNPIVDADNISKSRDPHYVSERLALWPEFMKHINEFYNTSCKFDDISPDACNLGRTDASNSRSSDSWLWQQCSELGFFIVPDTGAHYLFPQSGTWGSVISDCQRFFSSRPSNELNDLIARVSPTNSRYGGLKMRPSNVFWSGGQYDPWRSLTPLAGDEVVCVSQEIPACGVSPESDSIFGVLLPDASHCAIIGKNTTQVQQARRLFADALREWLKCF